MKLDRNYFAKQVFKEKELEKYKIAARRDLFIAHKSKEPEVTFHFTYMALLKTGIYVLAKDGYRLKSRPGHHQKLIEAMGILLGKKEVAIFGDKMRRDRNQDLYSANAFISEKDVKEYFDFVSEITADIFGIEDRTKP